MKITFENIKGYDKERQEVLNLIKMFKNYEKFKALGIEIPKGVIFYGPPGVGKTMFSKALAEELKRHFIEVDFVGLKEKEITLKLKNAFLEAKENTPSIVFIDEIDKLVPEEKKLAFINKNSESKTTLALLLQLLDGFVKNEEITVVATTNDLQSLPKSLIRSGRIDKYIGLNNPDDDSRKSIIEYYLSKINVKQKIDINQFVLSSEGLSGADIKNIINQACTRAITEEKSEVTTMDILEHIHMVTCKSLMETLSEEESKIVGYHELGHYIVGRHYNKSIKDVSIIQSGLSLGRVRVKNDIFVKTTKDVLTDVVFALGGSAAEKVFLKEEYIGSKKDFSDVYLMLKDLVNSGVFGFEYLNLSSDLYVDTTDEKNNNKIKELIQESYNEAVKIIIKYKKEIEILHPILMDKKILSNKEIEKALQINT